METDAPTADTSGPQARTSKPWLFPAGIGLLAICIVASAALVVQHLGGLSIPGCGADSPCAKAASSVWGKVPGTNWPVSFVGLAYFTAALVAWIAWRGTASAGFANLVRLGALASIGFATVMVLGDYLCPYCIAAHAANLGFWLVVEGAGMPAASSRRPLVTVGAVFAIATAGLVGADLTQKMLVREKEERQLAESTEAIIQQQAQARPSTASSRVTSMWGSTRIPRSRRS